MKKKLLFISLSLFSLISCSGRVKNSVKLDTATVRIFKANDETSPKSRYISPKNVSLKYSYDTLSGTLSNNESVFPSTGTNNLLVIPVHIPGSEEYKTDKVLEDIKTMMFGENDPKNGFMSVKEYYKEASFNKLNIEGLVTDWFDASEAGIKGPNDITQGTNGTIVQILNKAVEWAKAKYNLNFKDYDNNFDGLGDGSIDGVWLIYDHLDWSTEALLSAKNGISNQLNTSFWNFTGWDYSTAPNLHAPTTSGFSWASFDMMYTSYCSYESIIPDGYTESVEYPVWDETTLLDSHTFIHETGHLLGLNDYYATDSQTYRPSGKLTMMDQNVYDLDSYSKMLLGWVTPFVVYGSSEIILPPANKGDHNVIVIPSNYQEISTSVESYSKYNKEEPFKYEFNPFSEYLLIDLYTPDGLNYKDTYGDKIYFRQDLDVMTRSGVRIYHCDGRIFKCRVYYGDSGTKLVYDKDNPEWDGSYLESNEAVLMPISNSRQDSSTYQLDSSYDVFDELRLIESSGYNSFSSDGCANDSTLFTPNSKVFSIEDFGFQFFNSKYSFNDGNSLPFKIKIKSISEVEYE